MEDRQKSQTDCFDDLFFDSSLLSLPLPQLMMEKEIACNRDEICSELFNVQQQLVRLQTRLEDRPPTKAKHRQAQDQLEAMKSHYSSNTSQESKARANGETITL